MKAKRTTLAAVLVLIAILLQGTLTACGKEEDEAPTPVLQTDDFTVYTSELSPVKLSSFVGRPIVVNFWATWCPPCKAELPSFNSLYEKYKNEVAFLMVNVDDTSADVISEVKEFIAEAGYTFPVYYDTRGIASATYGISSIPETLFITSEGKLHSSHLGFMSLETLEKYISEITEN